MVVVVGDHLAQLLRGQLYALAVSGWEARDVAPDDQKVLLVFGHSDPWSAAPKHALGCVAIAFAGGLRLAGVAALGCCSQTALSVSQACD